MAAVGPPSQLPSHQKRKNDAPEAGKTLVVGRYRDPLEIGTNKAFKKRVQPLEFEVSTSAALLQVL